MIFYSHVNEDNRIELKLLEKNACQVVVALTGSGERVISLMGNDSCKEIHAVDKNLEAIFLLQLKITILKKQSVDNYLKFCGHYPSSAKFRRLIFFSIKEELPMQCKSYWEWNIHKIEKGILYSGQYERFLNRIRPMVNVFLGKNFQTIFSTDKSAKKHFPAIRWNIMTRLFACKIVYKLSGNNDIAFISRDACISHIPIAINESIKKDKVHSNFMMHLIFKGHLRDMDTDELPPSLQKENLQKIKDKLVNGTIDIHYNHTDILSYLNNYQSFKGSSVLYSLSDILSFENYNYISSVIDKLSHSENIIIWRSFLRNRDALNELNIPLELYRKVQSLTESESTGMYQVYLLQP